MVISKTVRNAEITFTVLIGSSLKLILGFLFIFNPQSVDKVSHRSSQNIHAAIEEAGSSLRIVDYFQNIRYNH